MFCCRLRKADNPAFPLFISNPLSSSHTLIEPPCLSNSSAPLPPTLLPPNEVLHLRTRRRSLGRPGRARSAGSLRKLLVLVTFPLPSMATRRLTLCSVQCKKIVRPTGGTGMSGGYGRTAINGGWSCYYTSLKTSMNCYYVSVSRCVRLNKTLMLAPGRWRMAPHGLRWRACHLGSLLSGGHGPDLPCPG